LFEECEVDYVVGGVGAVVDESILGRAAGDTWLVLNPVDNEVGGVGGTICREGAVDERKYSCGLSDPYSQERWSCSHRTVVSNLCLLAGYTGFD
jgi:hypothetical protein